MSLNILIMVSSLTNGGAERVACSWANGLVRLGHNVSIISNIKGKTYSLENKVHLIQSKSILINKSKFLAKVINIVINPFISLFQLLSIFSKSEAPDVVINVMYNSQYMLLLSRLLSTKHFPIIMTDHNAYERPPQYPFKWKQWKNKFIDNRIFEKVTVLTKRDKIILDKKGIKNVEVLYNPLFLTPAPEVPNKKNYIIAVGRVDSWSYKGFDILIKAWDSIALNYTDWKLRIIGKGNAESINYLSNLVDDIDSIEFVPFTNNIEREYKDASIFVLSSRYEGWGLVMIEAMSQGCAVVACDYKGRQGEAITDGLNGLLCETENVKALADKITLLIENPNIRKTLQENAIKSVNFYKEDEVAKRLEQIIYDQL